MKQRKFIIVTWPESQVLEPMEGFDSNAYLINDNIGLSEYGSSAYFVDEQWYKYTVKHVNLQ